MMSFFLDSSALAKRYVPETGSLLMDFILDNVPEDRLHLLNIGFTEVVSVLVRKKNAGTITDSQFGQALLEFEKEIIQSLKHLLSFDNSVATDALALIIKHSINATDGVLLRVAMISLNTCGRPATTWCWSPRTSVFFKLPRRKVSSLSIPKPRIRLPWRHWWDRNFRFPGRLSSSLRPLRSPRFKINRRVRRERGVPLPYSHQSSKVHC
jgi:uncharacterized protein